MTLAPPPAAHPLAKPPQPAAPRLQPTPGRIPNSGLWPPSGATSGKGRIIPDPPGCPPLVRITVDEYDDWIERGILPTNPTIELIDGLLVRKDRSHVGEDPVSIGAEHRYSVEQVADLRPRVEAFGSIVQTQQPVRLPDLSEPEPDGAILIGTRQSFRRRKPSVSDVTCVVEVADSSLRTDRTVKLAMYAAAGIPQYVIVNLVGRAVLDHRDPLPAADPPRYARATTLGPGEVVTLLLANGETLDVPVSDLLP